MVKKVFNLYQETVLFSFTSKATWFLGGIIFLLVAIFNSGLIALDDYSCIVSQIIPAQQISFDEVIATLGIRHPLAVLLLATLSKTIYRIGISNPMVQIALIRILIGSLNFFVFSYFGCQFFKKSDSLNYREWVLGLLCLYFVNPLFFTRPMIEALSAPFLFLSSFYAFRYWNEKSKKSVLISLCFLTFASMFRFQAGVCILALVVLILIRKDILGFIWFIGAGVGLCLLSGLMEVLITGKFHGALRDYVTYNLNHSSGYGVTPFYTFFLLLLGFTFPPLLISRFKKMNWKKEYQAIFPVLLFVGMFVLAHSIVPHKEERFMIPILPLFLVSLVPITVYFGRNAGARWRLTSLLVANSILLILVSFNAPQNNTVNLVKYLGERADIKNVLSVEQTLVLYPTAYVLKAPTVRTIPFNNLNDLKALPCDELLVARKDYLVTNNMVVNDLKQVAQFSPGPLEQLVIKLNPKQNLRRGTILVYADPKCESKF